MGNVIKSKAKIRQQIIWALAHGTNGRNPHTKGLIQLLTEKLEKALKDIDHLDTDGLTKLAQSVIRLSAIAMPTAYQAEALEKGLAPGSGATNTHQEIFALLERTLAERRQLLASQATYIDVTPNVSRETKDAARQELAKRLTPPPACPQGGVRENVGSRGPTPAQTSSQEQVSGTKQTSLNMEEIHEEPLPELDMEDDGKLE